MQETMQIAYDIGLQHKLDRANFNDDEQFLQRLMDRLEGKTIYAGQYTALLMLKQSRIEEKQ